VIRNFARVLKVLWAGSLWSVSWVTWVLFHSQIDRHTAGILAGPLFTIETYVGLAAVVVTLLLPGRTRYLWAYVAAALMALNEWALRPVMESARLHGKAAALSFGAWHGVSAVLYLGAGILLLVLVWNEDFR